ncbi:MAG: hypothetical protein EB127_29910 [Alphaproteobacteria bacterium]|nr:hypothetical protein [Alphaproteobacteria bacterium]
MEGKLRNKGNENTYKIGGGDAGPGSDKFVSLAKGFRSNGDKNNVQIGLMELEDITLEELQEAAAKA